MIIKNIKNMENKFCGFGQCSPKYIYILITALLFLFKSAVLGLSELYFNFPSYNILKNIYYLDKSEVEYGYNDEEALKEASRCLQCKVPRCVQGCPVSINIPAFIEQVKERNFERAYEIIS